MEQKSVKIQVPEGYEIDKENSTFEEIKFKPIKKQITYKDVAKELFDHKPYYWPDSQGDIWNFPELGCLLTEANTCTSRKQAEKLLAINKLMNVAKYLSDGWKPDWNNTQENKWQINIYRDNFNYMVSTTSMDMAIPFKTKELAQQAVEILGEDVIRLALCTDY